jgi:hypothetical protein
MSRGLALRDKHSREKPLAILVVTNAIVDVAALATGTLGHCDR